MRADLKRELNKRLIQDYAFKRQGRYVDHAKNLHTTTVRFALDNGSWWERLIDHPERFGGMKARFAPGKKRAGLWYTGRVAMVILSQCYYCLAYGFSWVLNEFTSSRSLHSFSWF